MPICRAASCCVRPRRRIARVISIARPDLILSCSASESPKSANTLPELTSNSMPFIARLAICHLFRNNLSCLESQTNGVQIFFRRTDSTLALLLKTVQNEYGLLEPDCVHSAVCSIRVVFNDLQHSGASEALERLCSIVCFAVLSEVQSMTEEFSYRNRKRHQVLLAAANPDEGLFGDAHSDYTLKGISANSGCLPGLSGIFQHCARQKG